MLPSERVNVKPSMVIWPGLIAPALIVAFELPSVPLAHDLASSETGRQAIRVLEADSVLAWPMLAPPGLAPERVAELRDAFDRMLKDGEVLAEAARQGLDIDPVSGQEIQDLVDGLYRVPADVMDYVRRISAAR